MLVLAVVACTASAALKAYACQSCGSHSQNTRPAMAPQSCSCNTYTFPNCNGTTDTVRCYYLDYFTTCSCGNSGGGSCVFNCLPCMTDDGCAS